MVLAFNQNGLRALNDNGVFPKSSYIDFSKMSGMSIQIRAKKWCGSVHTAVVFKPDDFASCCKLAMVNLCEYSVCKVSPCANAYATPFK